MLKGVVVACWQLSLPFHPIACSVMENKIWTTSRHLAYAKIRFVEPATNEVGAIGFGCRSRWRGQGRSRFVGKAFKVKQGAWEMV
jgi:hypothetical protein